MSDIKNIFKNIESRLTIEKAKQINASYLFHIGINDIWLIDLTKKSNWIKKADNSTKAQCSIIISNPKDWEDLTSGNLTPTSGFMQGKIKIKGNMSLAMKLQALLS
jgi:putative sterol carrier protein